MPFDIFGHLVGGGSPNMAGAYSPLGTGRGTVTATPTNLTSGNTYSYNPALGGIPNVPSPAASQATSTAGNVSALPGLQNLAGQVNPFQQAALTGQYSALNPAYIPSYNQAGQNIAAQLRGELPPDAVNSLAQSLAESGVAGGTTGSPNAISTAALRYLGGSLGQQQQGLSNLLNLTAGSPVAKPYDITQGFLSPDYIQQQQYLANVLGAAPDPTAAYNLNMANARSGLQLGSGQYGGRSPTSSGGQSVSEVVDQILKKYSSGNMNPYSGQVGAPQGGSTGYENPMEYTTGGGITYNLPDNYYTNLDTGSQQQYQNMLDLAALDYNPYE